MGSFQWTHTKVGIVAGGLVALLLLLPKVGDGLSYAARLVRTPDVAYAAKDKADDVDTKFNQYLVQQQAYTNALQSYVTQQQQQMQAPNQPYRVPQALTIREWDGERWWCCPLTPDDREACYARDLWQRC